MTATDEDRTLLALYAHRRCRYSATVAKQGKTWANEQLTVMLADVAGPDGGTVAEHLWHEITATSRPLLRCVGRRVSFTAIVETYPGEGGVRRLALAEIAEVRHNGRAVS